ncbi:hypothetical protein Arad_8091 [Rhizobium rhizogenes K84]|uniref:Uncharacterized protein n=1 Tax=Rhizobium rhizogenes (strain K84 / ATCC BAA-868) TaxID=311403 RepID=B9JHQ1_RHIR8|nr:hypothetical protein Arad_8091 [Rhizobium rhizogenes K84]
MRQHDGVGISGKLHRPNTRDMSRGNDQQRQEYAPTNIANNSAGSLTRSPARALHIRNLFYDHVDYLALTGMVIQTLAPYSLLNW